MVMLYAGGYVMGAWDSFWFVMGRAWDISFSLMGPVTILLWLSAMVGIIWMHVRRPRLASLMAVFTAVMAFFVIWNHPDFAWYKHRPWHGGYSYSWAMVLIYVLVPVTLGRLARRAWLWARGKDWEEKRRKAKEFMDKRID